MEIAWGKEMRGTYDHTGLSEAKAESHTRRLLYPGMRERNKHQIQIFPFNFMPMNSILEKRKIDCERATGVQPNERIGLRPLRLT